MYGGICILCILRAMHNILYFSYMHEYSSSYLLCIILSSMHTVHHVLEYVYYALLFITLVRRSIIIIWIVHVCMHIPISARVYYAYYESSYLVELLLVCILLLARVCILWSYAYSFYFGQNSCCTLGTTSYEARISCTPASPAPSASVISGSAARYHLSLSFN